MSYVTINTDVDVYLEDFDDKDLIEELRDRGYYVSDEEKTQSGLTSLEDLYISWTLDRNNFEEKFRDYCRQNLGRSF